MKLQSKVAVITGAARGIGKAIAEHYAKEGAKVFLSDILETDLEATGQSIVNNGGVAKWCIADVTKQADVENMIDTAVKEFGTVDILVNNAGIMDLYEPPHELSDEFWQQIFDVNVTALMRTMRKTVPIFLDKSKGNIINIASISGRLCGIGGTAYVGSKWAVVGMTKSAAHLYADNNIRVNAICPGIIETPILEPMLNGNMTKWPRVHNMVKDVHTVPFGQPEHIAKAAVFLASDDSDWVNGDIMTVDGGFSATF